MKGDIIGWRKPLNAREVVERGTLSWKGSGGQSAEMVVSGDGATGMDGGSRLKNMANVERRYLESFIFQKGGFNKLFSRS